MPADFDLFIKQHWPPEVPAECLSLWRQELDCLDRRLPFDLCCTSCQTYARLTERYNDIELAQTTEP